MSHVTGDIWMSHVTCMNESRMSGHSWLIHTWLIHVCDMAHSEVRHDAFICATLLHMCDMTHSYLQRDLFICATWFLHMCDVTHSYVRHDSGRFCLSHAAVKHWFIFHCGNAVGPFQWSQIRIQWDVSENIQVQKNLLGPLKVSWINISQHITLKCWFQSTKHWFGGQLIDTKAGVPDTVSQKEMLLHDQFQCWQKVYPIPYRNTLPV